MKVCGRISGKQVDEVMKCFERIVCVLEIQRQKWVRPSNVSWPRISGRPHPVGKRDALQSPLAGLRL